MHIYIMKLQRSHSGVMLIALYSRCRFAQRQLMQMGNLLRSVLHTDGRLRVVMVVLMLRVGVILEHVTVTVALHRFRMDLLHATE